METVTWIKRKKNQEPREEEEAQDYKDSRLKKVGRLKVRGDMS